MYGSKRSWSATSACSAARAPRLCSQGLAPDWYVLVHRALSALKACYDQLRSALPANDDSLGALIGNIEDPGIIADVVCAAALNDPAIRQRALAETHVASRLELATEGLADLLLSHAPEADVVH